MTDKPIYLPAAPGAELIVVWASEVDEDDQGAPVAPGTFEAVVDRYPIIAWVIEKSSDSHVASPITTATFNKSVMQLVSAPDGTLIEVGENGGYKTLADAKKTVVWRAERDWKEEREAAAKAEPVTVAGAGVRRVGQPAGPGHPAPRRGRASTPGRNR
jgi:hypothetical protein